MILNEDAIRKAISAAVYETFGESAVASVEMEFLDDAEPMNDVMNVRIVLNRGVALDALSRVSLKLREVLSNLDNDYFPLVSLISENEFRRGQR
jgi:hypothetical protein